MFRRILAPALGGVSIFLVAAGMQPAAALPVVYDFSTAAGTRFNTPPIVLQALNAFGLGSFADGQFPFQVLATINSNAPIISDFTGGPGFRTTAYAPAYLSMSFSLGPLSFGQLRPIPGDNEELLIQWQAGSGVLRADTIDFGLGDTSVGLLDTSNPLFSDAVRTGTFTLGTTTYNSVSLRPSGFDGFFQFENLPSTAIPTDLDFGPIYVTRDFSARFTMEFTDPVNGRVVFPFGFRSFNTGSLAVSPVPELSSFAMLVGGLLILGLGHLVVGRGSVVTP
jgi:hypothetical protein